MTVLEGSDVRNIYLHICIVISLINHQCIDQYQRNGELQLKPLTLRGSYFVIIIIIII